ncbi:MAG: hypothetical protein ETSY1_28360 [Candidatus Entotheonella factor]|uniref:Uncharacterized protein n=1 Tax=Entotheonella factor TaxID=1429438 RepID=W4LF80_ENTF1|nr:MAG: hypothetical protein ETSY1_28360 [Candidatus Entotheonella factor]
MDFPLNEEVQHAFQLAFCLHPDRQIAIRITQYAILEFLPAMKQHQTRRPRAQKRDPYKVKLSDTGLIYQSVFWASEKWELDQEQSTQEIPDNTYRPTLNDMLVRYIKPLIYTTFDRDVYYLAFGLGCHLYQYNTRQIHNLMVFHVSSDNIRRVNKRILERIQHRFPQLAIDQKAPRGERKVLMRPPLEQEFAFTSDTLETLAPWWTPHFPKERSITNFFNVPPEKDDVHLAEEQKHALIDASCAGLERLIYEYTQHGINTMHFEKPQDQLGIPEFFDDDFNPSDPEDRFNPDPLSLDTVTAMKTGFELHQGRRRAHRSSSLQVYIDHQFQGSWDASHAEGLSISIPDFASFIEIYAEDQEGEFLLAIFPVDDLVELPQHEVWRLTCEGGQTIALTMMAKQVKMSNDDEACVVHLAYRPAPQSLLSRWRQAGAAWLDAAAEWLRPYFTPQWVPVCATALMLVLLASNTWLGLHQLRPGDESRLRGEPGAVRGTGSSALNVELVLQPESSAIEIYNLLQQIEGQIVSGPSQSGGYTVEVHVSKEQLEQLLKAHFEVVEAFEIVTPLP